MLPTFLNSPRTLFLHNTWTKKQLHWKNWRIFVWWMKKDKWSVSFLTTTVPVDFLGEGLRGDRTVGIEDFFASRPPIFTVQKRKRAGGGGGGKTSIDMERSRLLRSFPFSTFPVRDWTDVFMQMKLTRPNRKIFFFQFFFFGLINYM